MEGKGDMKVYLVSDYRPYGGPILTVAGPFSTVDIAQIAAEDFSGAFVYVTFGNPPPTEKEFTDKTCLNK